MLAIKCFGHFWSKELVDWGTRGRAGAGRLLGYQLRDRRPFTVDFGEQIGIYVLFSAGREAIYIGQTGAGDQRLLTRLRQHSHGSIRDRWTNFSWFGFRSVNQTGRLSEHQQPESKCAGSHTDALDEIESVLLQLFEPRLNKQGPRWGEGTEEFLQYVPWEFGEEPRPVNYEAEMLLLKMDELAQALKTIKS
jgi:hypothetical protein